MICGNERFLWGAAKVGIDHEQEYRRQRAENGAAGGRPAKAKESNEKQEKAKESNGKQQKANKSRNEYETNGEYECECETNSELDIGAEQAPPPGFTLKDGSRYVLTPDQMEQLAADFPGLSAFTILRDIERWCDANPSKRKTEAGAMKFVNAWFVREREKRAQWREEAKARNEKPEKPEKKRTGKYDEIYDKY